MLLATVLGCTAGKTAPRVVSSSPMKAPQRLLFVGNSFTFYNGGIDNHVRDLAASAHPPRLLETDRAAKGGATLKILQDLAWLHEKIREGRYDLVILQEDLPELTERSVAPFHEHARRFDQEIRDVGGKTALFTHQTVG